MALRVRPLSDAEQTALARRAQSRTASTRLVERARIIWYAAQGQRVPVIATQLHLHQQTVRLWLKRFNPAGRAGLEDAPRSGRPATYTPEAVGMVIATALTNPQDLGQSFASWTLDRLQTYLNEEQHLTIKRSRIDEILIAEGLRWRQQETRFGERVDPAFAEKRGPSKRSTRARRKAV